MQKISPFLWFDGQAEEAAKFYTSLFADSKILRTVRYGESGPGPKGTVMTVSFKLEGQEFVALNGGPQFTFTPALSFFVTCTSENEIDALWKNLSERGKVLMELQKYPFSEKFGWVSDRYGLSWQLNLAGNQKRITPFLMFVGKQHGKAEEAMSFYTSLFEHSSIDQVERYGAVEGETEGTVVHGKFSLAGQQFMAMDSNREHQFTFTPALSLFVACETQAEVDEFWEKLSSGGTKDQCGWLQDRYGVSWQVVPTVLIELLGDPDPVRAQKVMEAMLKMKKLDIKELQQAYDQGKRGVR
jgi:predicted 3-demethylubiquinone-9 3-methyltransferase (glyoxalase superfamily)